MFKKIIFALFAGLYFTGCTTIVDPKIEKTNTSQLYHLLIKYNPKVSKSEAIDLSRTSVNYSRILATRYGANTTPLMHNALVNSGIKDRGLCYEWADDLQRELYKYGFVTMTIRPVAANIDRYNEHNALVVLPKNSTNLRQGVLLDPWRKSGELLFMPIMSDKKYNWAIRNR